MDKFENLSLKELMDYICLNKIEEGDAESYIKALYSAYCDSRNFDKRAKVVVAIMNDKDGKLSTHIAVQGGNVITINVGKFALSILNSDPGKRLDILDTLIHEHRHFMQKTYAPINRSPQFCYASLCLRCDTLMWDWLSSQKKFNEANKYAYDDIGVRRVDNVLEYVSDYLKKVRSSKDGNSYGVLPWELDARQFTLDEIRRLSDWQPNVCGELIGVRRKADDNSRKNYRFSIIEHLEVFEQASAQLRWIGNDEGYYIAKDIENLGFAIRSFLNINDIKTPEDEIEFVLNLYNRDVEKEKLGEIDGIWSI